MPKQTRANPWDEAQPAETTNETKQQGPKSGIHVRRVVQEFIPMVAEGDASFGQVIDNLIKEALETDGQVQEVGIQINDEDWFRLREQFRGNHK